MKLKRFDEINEAKSTLNDKYEKVSKIGYEQALKLIYGWVKNDNINFKDFMYLINTASLAEDRSWCK